MNWVWPHTSRWQSCVLLELHPTYGTELFMSPLPGLSVLTKCNSYWPCKSCSFLLFQLLCDNDVPPISGKWEASTPSIFFLPFIAGACADYHTRSRLRTPYPSVWAFSLQLPFCGTVICVMYVKMVLCIKYFGNQPKAVAVLTNFLAGGVCVSFGNISIHFMVTVIV